MTENNQINYFKKIYIDQIVKNYLFSFHLSFRVFLLYQGSDLALVLYSLCGQEGCT